jgi:histidinol-phosphate phosphatase family protein
VTQPDRGLPVGDGRRGLSEVAVVIPTVGRPSLQVLLDALAASTGPLPVAVVLVDDRTGDAGALEVQVPGRLADRVQVRRGEGRGPAAARNVGWRATTTAWVAFLDDDVVVPADWTTALEADLAHLPSWVAGSQGRITVPLPTDRRPTDWERNVAGLEVARWATADLAYRRAALVEVGGFDERFPRAYREDADLGLRLVDRGWWIERGDRVVLHPVRPSDPWVSVRLQAGNADDPLMGVLHGPGWRERAGVPVGRRPRHLAMTAAGMLAVGATLAGRRRIAAVGAAAWLAGTGELAWARIAPGPRTPAEIATMLATSAVLPAAATWHWLRGGLGVLRGAASGGTAGGTSGGAGPQRTRVAPTADTGSPPDPARPPAAVLFDRDGTLVEDVPYNGDPALVVLRPGARAALDRLRAAGIPTAMISNQSGIARGHITAAQVEAVNARVDALLGGLGPLLWCPHGPGDGCACRKPAPGLVHQAAAALGVAPADCVVIGDIGADVAAAQAAGATGILVPTPVTRGEEVAAAPIVVEDLRAAMDLLLGTDAPDTPDADPPSAPHLPSAPGTPLGVSP